jgi:secretion/DNA translocation related CpaE-like protein
VSHAIDIPAVPRPLVVSRRDDVLDKVRRLAAAGCAEVDVARDPAGARARWSRAPLVVIGQDSLDACLRAGLPHRPDVLVVADRERDDAVWQGAALIGAEHLVALPDAERWLVDRFAESTRDAMDSGRVVGVIGGRGGAGASVLAAAMAVTAVRQGRRVLLVDVDPLGGGLEAVVGRQGECTARWPGPIGVAGAASPRYDLTPRVGELCLLSWDRDDQVVVPPEAVDLVLDAGRRGSDLVIADLPRRLDEAAVRVLRGAHTVLLVVPAEVRATTAARRVLGTIRPYGCHVECVVRGPAPPGLRSRGLTDLLGVPLAGILRTEPGLAAALQRGEPPAWRGRGPLAELCRRLLGRVDTLPLAPVPPASGAA